METDGHRSHRANTNDNHLSNMRALFDLEPISSYVQVHLARTYMTLLVTILSCVVGSLTTVMYFQRFTSGLSYMAIVFGIFGLVIHIASTRQVEGSNSRYISLFVLAYLFGFLNGDIFKLLLISKQFFIVWQALGATIIIFGVFSVMAYFINSRYYLYMGSFLITSLSLKIWLDLFNIFFLQSQDYVDVSIYWGLFLFMGYVVYDTQLMIARFQRGDTDHVYHALALFLDFINIFLDVLHLISRNTNSKKKRYE
jgi:FtsH-binding integral membrane protein